MSKSMKRLQRAARFGFKTGNVICITALIFAGLSSVVALILYPFYNSAMDSENIFWVVILTVIGLLNFVVLAAAFATASTLLWWGFPVSKEDIQSLTS